MSKLAECSVSFVESTRLKHTSIIVQPKRLCYEFSTLPGYVFGVHVDFCFRAECFTGVCTCENTVKCPPGSWVGSNKKRSIINGTSSLPRMLATEQFYYVSIVGILLWEIKHRHCGLWWMERVSRISVTSTLKTFPKWPYKEFLKRCLLRIKRSNWWKTECIMNLCTLIFFYLFQFLWFWNTRHK